MFFKFEESKERTEERRQWETRIDQFLEETRAEREATRAEREEARAQREQSQQMFAALMEQNQLLTARLLDLLERRDGNGSGNAA